LREIRLPIRESEFEGPNPERNNETALRDRRKLVAHFVEEGMKCENCTHFSLFG
jgi:hypothetical protein